MRRIKVLVRVERPLELPGADEVDPLEALMELLEGFAKGLSEELEIRGIGTAKAACYVEYAAPIEGVRGGNGDLLETGVILGEVTITDKVRRGEYAGFADWMLVMGAEQMTKWLPPAAQATVMLVREVDRPRRRGRTAGSVAPMV